MPSASSFISHNCGQRFQQVNYYNCLAGQTLRKAIELPTLCPQPVFPSLSCMLSDLPVYFFMSFLADIFALFVFLCRPKDAIRAMKKRLNGNRNYREVMLALTVSAE